ncbi:MAG: DUF1207 domain-containing protein [Planctomycetes bacterium]|nr:DUF1207 domain-containing protein [Planctomycetota bacterium]
MLRSRVIDTVSFRALALLACAWPVIFSVDAASAIDRGQGVETIVESATTEVWQHEETSNPSVEDESLPALDEPPIVELPADSFLADEYSLNAWAWQWLPEGLIYHSYMAGVHEPRMALVTFYEAGDARTLWDATLGGRVGMLKYGNCDPANLEGYQLDFYGAAIARLDVENQQNLDSTDYVFGFPLTWGDEQLQFEFGYAHLSSHLGDEFAISHPGSLADRVNYVRDSFEFGASYYVIPAWRAYGEVGWAFHRSGGAEPLALQFGTELSRPGPTDRQGTPFIALNARLREEHDFGGDLAAQVGWLRRGLRGQTLRFGAHYYNGKSSQSQFFQTSEEQIGLGLWYDF